MVQLKAPCLSHGSLFSGIFQFQYGTIKSCIENLISDLRHKFQFQYGTIKRYYRDRLSQRRIKFQFQYGTIKRLDKIHKSSTVNEISIPIWYN